MHPGEKQLPTGPGQPPPSEPSIPGFRPDLPSLKEPERRGEPVPFGSFRFGGEGSAVDARQEGKGSASSSSETA